MRKNDCFMRRGFQLVGREEFWRGMHLMPWNGIYLKTLKVVDFVLCILQQLKKKKTCLESEEFEKAHFKLGKVGIIEGFCCLCKYPYRMCFK